MTKYLILVLICFLTTNVFGQKTYNATRQVYKDNKYNYKFHVYPDSTAIIIEYYADFAKFMLYKGRVSKTNDTLFEFRYKPVAELGCDRRFFRDTIDFRIQNVDTLIKKQCFAIKFDGSKDSLLCVSESNHKLISKKYRNKNLFIKTGIVNPFSKKDVVMTIHPSSTPNLTFYGSKTKQCIAKFSLSKNTLTLYRDKEHIHDNDTFVLTQ